MADDPAYQKATGLTADQIREAADNLASNEARARIDALHGKYSQTTDQFYEQEYRNLLFQGLSPREAEELAGKNALQYQAEKVSYLSDMLEGYGLNGGYMNNFGTRLVGMLGDTKGALGDYYAQMYRSPGAAQERANTVEDAVCGHQFGQENSLFTTYLNNAFADADLPRALQKIFATGDVNLPNALATGQQSEDFRIAGEGRAERRTIAAERRAQAYEQQRLAQLDQWADSVFEGEDAKIAKAAIRGIKLPQKKGETISDDSLKNLKTLHDMLSKRAQALRELLAKGDQWNPDPQVVKQYDEVVQQMAQIEEAFGDKLFGVEGVVYEWSNDEAKNLQGIRNVIAAEGNATPEAKWRAVRDFAPSSVSDEELRALIEKAMISTVSEAVAAGARAR